MSAGTPIAPNEFAADAVEGAIFGGVIIPVFQMIILEIFAALPQTKFKGSITIPILITLVVMNLLPVISTLGSMAMAYAIGGRVATTLYVIMAIAASALLGNPVMGMIVLLVSIAVMAIWLAITGSRQNTTRRRL
jgi:mannose/fructose/N-acetylgalactosamine-specific phosphotransferase system component IID